MLEDFLFQDSCMKTLRGTYVLPSHWREDYFFTEHATMEDVLEKTSVTESMFTTWMIAIEKFEDARALTYGQFVSKFVYEKRTRSWKPRKKGFTIGRLIWAPPTTGELFF